MSSLGERFLSTIRHTFPTNELNQALTIGEQIRVGDFSFLEKNPTDNKSPNLAGTYEQSEQLQAIQISDGSLMTPEQAIIVPSGSPQI